MSKEFIVYGQEFCAGIILLIGVVLFIRNRTANLFIALYYLFTAIALTRIFDQIEWTLIWNLDLQDLHPISVQLTLIFLFYYASGYLMDERDARKILTKPQHLLIQFPAYLLLIISILFQTEIDENGNFVAHAPWFFAIRLTLFILSSVIFLLFVERFRVERQRVTLISSRFIWFIRLQYLVPLLFQIPIVFLSLAFPDISPFYDLSNLIIWSIYILTPGMIPEVFFSLNKVEEIKRQKYFSSSLSKEHELAVFNQVKDFMESNRPYLKQDFSLQYLAKELNINATYISQAVNNQVNMSFSDFVNEYRVLKAMDMIKSSGASNFKIESIGEFAGFKSKATFYRAFKKKTGRTPTEI